MMPNLDDMLKKAINKDSARTKKSVTKGVRPDRLIREAARQSLANISPNRPPVELEPPSLNGTVTPSDDMGISNLEPFSVSATSMNREKNQIHNQTVINTKSNRNQYDHKSNASIKEEADFEISFEEEKIEINKQSSLDRPDIDYVINSQSNQKNETHSIIDEEEENIETKIINTESRLRNHNNDYVIKTQSSAEQKDIYNTALIPLSSRPEEVTSSPSKRNHKVINTESDANFLHASVIKTKSNDNHYEIGASSHAESNTKSNTESNRNHLEPNFEYYSLSKLEYETLNFLFDLCVKLGSRRTPKMRYSIIAQATSTTVKTSKNTLQRLVKRGGVKRVEWTKGPGAWTIYEIPESVYRLIILSTGKDSFAESIIHNHPRLRNRSVINSTENTQSQTKSNSSSKLVSNLNTNLTNYGSSTEGPSVYDEYDQIDIGSLANLRVTRKQLYDIKNQKLGLTRSQLENLIFKFERYATNPKNKVHSPPGLFVRMAQEIAKGNDPLPHIETNEDHDLKALKERLLVEKASRQREVEEVKGLLFEQWFHEASTQEKETLVSSQFVKGEPYMRALRAKWEEVILPQSEESSIVRD